MFIPTSLYRAVVLLALLSPVGAAAQEGVELVSARKAEGQIRWAQRWQLDVYGRKLAFTGNFRKPACDIADGSDCFQGEYECVQCLWKEDRSELYRLGEVYDSVGRLLTRARGGVRVDRLNWLAGQRVGLWSRMGELGRAREAADQCVAQLWWCEALAGLVDHRDGDSRGAEERFARALPLMPDGLACYWNEIVMYRDSMARSVGHDAYGRHFLPKPNERRPCAGTDELTEFWTLADPLWSVEGNERKSEHYARMVDAYIHHQFLQVMDIRGTHMLSHHSVLIRHGWPTGYRWQIPPSVSPMPMPPRAVRLAPDPLAQGPDSTPGTTYELKLLYGRGQSFVFAGGTEEAMSATWDRFVPAGDHHLESYPSAHGLIHGMPLQSGYFRRDGGDVLVVRAARPDPAPAADAAWSIMVWDGDDFRSGVVSAAADTLTAWLDTPWQPQLVSLEAVGDDAAWRARSGTRPPPSAAAVALSSVVLLDSFEDEPDQLDEAVRLMLPTTDLAAARPLGAYWEIYSETPVNARVEIVLRSVEQVGLIRRIVGAVPPPEPRVAWEELIEPVDGRAARTFDLDLSALPPGPYRFELAVTLDNGEVLRSDAPFTVAEQQ